MELYTAFIIGLVGSLHCVGMCGPIALILPGNAVNKANYLGGRLLYNTGRILTYGLMGLIAGFLGNKIILYGYQQVLSISLGIIILLIVLIPRRFWTVLNSGRWSFRRFQNSIGRLLKTGSAFSLLSIGLFNGFLPCGLVYLGLATAASSGSALDGMVVMIIFGTGTFPLMFAVSSTAKFLPVGIRNKAARLGPYFALVLGLIFILRGLNLGIPYVSPSINKTAVNQHNCCTQAAN